MSYVNDPRTVKVPPQLLAAAKSILAEHGATRGARLLGVSRNSLLSVVAIGYAMPGTVALLRSGQTARAEAS